MNPSEAVDVLESGHETLMALVAELSPERGSEPRALGGGDWSVKDLIGHVETWEQVALDSLEDFRSGAPARIGQIVTGRESLDTFNLGEVRRKAESQWTDALHSYQETHRRLVGELRAMSDEEWNAPIPDRPEGSLGDGLGSNTGAPGKPFGHVFAHLDDLKAFVAG